MNELFGVSMNYIAGVCVALTVAILLFVALIAWRNPVMFKMGLRNIPRRKAQTTLIIIGLMLSTVIMSAAFGTGDTLSSSVTNEVYNIALEADEDITWNSDDFPVPESERVIPIDEIDVWSAQFQDDEDIEAIVPYRFATLPIQDTSTRLNEPAAGIMGFRADDAERLGGIKDVSGNAITLEPGEIAVNEDLQDQLDASVGDTVVLYSGTDQLELTVTAIVPNTLFGGALNTFSKQGGALNFDQLGEFTGMGDTADGAIVSNVGGVRSGLDRTDAAVDKIEPLLEGTSYEIVPFKQDGIELAELIGAAFTTIFVVFGLFSIAAGVLLIFLIFIMLAAERKPEMGMARAVGAKRRQIVESFLAEGMGYDLGSAVVGLVVGMGVTLAMVEIIKAFAGDALGLDLVVSFSPRSLITAFCIGVIATFLVIFIASWRASRLNITAAIRDLPDTKPINPESGTWRGYYRAVLNGLVALALPIGLSFILAGQIGMLLGLPLVLIGLITPWFYVLRGSNFAVPAEHRTDEGAPKWPWILGLAIPVIGWVLILPWYFIALLLVRIVRDRKPASMPGWMPAVGIALPPFGFVVALLQDHRAQILWSAGIASGFGIAGIALLYTGLATDTAFPFFLGFSLILLWVAVTLRYFGVSERLSFTSIGILLLISWYVPSSVYEDFTGELRGDIDMFFLSGMVMVTAATFVTVYNADIVLPAIARLGSRFGRIMPAIKTGVAYPLTARFRTGVTMVMIGLIMFSLVMMATINHNFAAVFLNEDSKGGFDVVAAVNDNSPIEDFTGALEDAGVDTSQVEATGELVGVLAEFENIDGKEDSDDEVTGFLRYTLYGANANFFDATTIPLKERADGYDTDQEVWEALRDDPSLAVVNAAVTLPPDPFAGPVIEDQLQLDELDPGFEPFSLEVREPGTENTTTITVIGQMKDSADVFLALGGMNGGAGGILTGAENITSSFSEISDQRYYVRLDEGADSRAYARAVEAGLVQASADSLDQLLDEQQSAQNGFILVFQGFMGLGLIVGIAALAVVASRAVVERRQQIGMLRAIGYQRSMVALSFLFESGFIAVSGILMGLGLGLSLAWVLFITGEFGEETENSQFLVPWLNLAIICAIAFFASMLMTFLPARAASKVPIADALRYE